MKNRLFALAVSAVILGTSALSASAYIHAEDASAPTVTADEKTEIQKYQIYPEKIDVPAIMEQAEIESYEYAASLDRNVYTEDDIEMMRREFYNDLTQERQSKAMTERCEKVLEAIGIAKEDAEYLEHPQVIYAALTTEQMKAAEECELVREFYEYNPPQKPDWDSYEYPLDVLIWGKTTPLITEEQENEINYESIIYAESFDSSQYTHNQLENFQIDYYRKKRTELIKKAVAEQQEKIIAELGIKDTVKSRSMLTLTMTAELTREQVAIAENSELIDTVIPVQDIPTAENAGYPVTTAVPAATMDTYTEDFLKSLAPGDANMDYVTTLADSLLILQYIANSEKYPLEGQALINADCCDPGSGITPLDALAIQKYDAKLLLYLPEHTTPPTAE
ncbi:MAG TPA: dockerin type I repeat-containing protein [Ruminococcus sp.]|nr:dockerin type I repeat-containing protein [Ruminococcus sp.]